ncbi:hypothetical protein SUGI_0724500 [Cryptomeria japonica]|nr:hypothetical protein SUGI_0724500 [Cryptomeria japonica]
MWGSSERLRFTLIQRSRISMIWRSIIISETGFVKRNCRREAAIAPVVWNTTRGIPNLEADCAVQSKKTSLIMQAGFREVSAMTCSSQSSNGWESLCEDTDNNWPGFDVGKNVGAFAARGEAGDEREIKRNNTNGGSKRLRLQFGGRGSGGDKADGEALGSKHFSQAEEGNEMALRHVREHHYVLTFFSFCHCNMVCFAQ